MRDKPNPPASALAQEKKRTPWLELISLAIAGLGLFVACNANKISTTANEMTEQIFEAEGTHLAASPLIQYTYAFPRTDDVSMCDVRTSAVVSITNTGRTGTSIYGVTAIDPVADLKNDGVGGLPEYPVELAPGASTVAVFPLAPPSDGEGWPTVNCGSSGEGETPFAPPSPPFGAIKVVLSESERYEVQQTENLQTRRLVTDITEHPGFDAGVQEIFLCAVRDELTIALSNIRELPPIPLDDFGNPETGLSALQGCHRR